MCLTRLDPDDEEQALLAQALDSEAGSSLSPATQLCCASVTSFTKEKLSKPLVVEQVLSDYSMPSTVLSTLLYQNSWAKQASFSLLREEETETQTCSGWPKATR